MHKVVPFLLALALISTTGCAELIDPRRDYLQWRDSLGLPSAPAGHERVQTEQRNAVNDADGCIGAVVNGVCHGTINPSIQPVAHCYGTMISDQCTGPLY
ncbi:hypothetical protein D3C84_1047020 [compost metagenome]